MPLPSHAHGSGRARDAAGDRRAVRMGRLLQVRVPLPPEGAVLQVTGVGGNPGGILCHRPGVILPLDFPRRDGTLARLDGLDVVRDTESRGAEEGEKILQAPVELLATLLARG